MNKNQNIICVILDILSKKCVPQWKAGVQERQRMRTNTLEKIQVHRLSAEKMPRSGHVS